MTVESEDVENRELAETSKVNANIYANTSQKNPAERLAESWNSLSIKTKARITAIIAEILEQT